MTQPARISPGMKRLYNGDFNVMQQERQPDGSVVLTFYRHGEAQAVQLHVSYLYGEHETVLNESTVDHGPPAWVAQRQHEAGQ